MALFSFTIAKGASVKDGYQSLANTPEGFIEALIKRGHALGSKDGSAIILSTFKKGTRIEQKNIDQITGLALDFDGKFVVNGKKIQERLDVEALLKIIQFKGIAHSSYSNTEEFPKFRVLLPLARPITFQQHYRLWWYFYDLTMRKADPSGKNPDRLFFLPRVPDENAKHIAWVRGLDGPVLDYDTIPANYKPPEDMPSFEHQAAKKKKGAHKAANDTQFGHQDPRLLLEKLEDLPLFQWAIDNPTAINREVWRGLATNIAAAVEEDSNAHDAGSELFHEISELDEDRYEWGITERTYRDAFKSISSHGPMTFQRFKENGAPAEVCDDLGTGAKAPLGLVRMMYRAGPKPKASPPAEIPPVVEEAKETDYSKSSPTLEEKLTSSVGALIASSASSAPPSTTPPPTTASTSPSVPPQTPSQAAEEEGEADIFDLTTDDFLFDREQNVWLMKDNDGVWHPMVEQAFTHTLAHMGLPSKKQGGYKARIRQFQYRAPVWNQPDVEYVMVNGLPVLNIYKATKLQPKAGNWDDIRALMLNLCGNDPAGLEYVLDWLALPLQHLHAKHPTTGVNIGRPFKMGTALVFHGDPGSGKGLFSQIMEALYGKMNTTIIGQNELDNRFNGELLDKLFVIANEVMSSTNRSAETANKIKPWVTDLDISIEQKFMGSKLVQNSFNIVFTSNDERPVIIDRGDRRYTVFKSSVFDHDTGARIAADVQGPRTMVAAFFDHLLTRKTHVGYGQLFESEARREMIAASAPSDERFAREILEEGWLAVSHDWTDGAPNGKIRQAVTPDGLVLSNTMKEVYEFYCRQNNLKARYVSRFGITLKRIIPAVNDVRTRDGGVQLRAWENVPLHGPGEVISLEEKKQEIKAVAQAKPASKPVDNGDFNG